MLAIILAAIIGAVALLMGIGLGRSSSPPPPRSISRPVPRPAPRPALPGVALRQPREVRRG
jgi:hypothetical protein